MKTLIIYKTKYGSTKEYADFIHSRTSNSEMCSIEEINIKKLNEYDIIVIGSRTFMGKIESKDFLIENWEVLKNKNVFLYVVGMIKQNSKESIDSYEQIPLYIRNHIKYIKVPGRIDFGKLNLFEKMVVRARNSLNTDKVKMSEIEPVILYVHELSNNN